MHLLRLLMGGGGDGEGEKEPCMMPAGQTAAEGMPGSCVTCGCLLEFPFLINNYLKLYCGSLDVLHSQVPECVLTPGLELYPLISLQGLSFPTPFCRAVLPLPESLGSQQLDVLFFEKQI